MIKGKEISEKAYRAIDFDSYSTLKDFSMDRRLYFRRYMSGELVKDEDTQAILIGKVVETLLFEREKFDEYFHILSVPAPTEKMLDFVNALIRNTLLCVDQETGEVTKNFDEIIRIAYEDSGYKISLERVVGSFSGKEPEIYYHEVMDVMKHKKSIVEMSVVSLAETIAGKVLINEFIADIIKQDTDERYEVFHQLKVTGFLLHGHQLKAMLDLVIVDHQTKTISIYDLKCTWDNEGFYYNYYLKRRAYMQGYIYTKAMEWLIKNDPELKEKYKGYKVENLAFIVLDSNAFNGPIIYSMSNKDMHDAMVGFSYNSRQYPGTRDVIRDLRFALENNIWEYSRETYENKGIKKLIDY